MFIFSDVQGNVNYGRGRGVAPVRPTVPQPGINSRNQSNVSIICNVFYIYGQVDLCEFIDFLLK